MRRGFELLKPSRPTTFGSASWMEAHDFRRPRISARGVGPFIGYHVHLGTRGRELFGIYATDPGHLLTVAPTRSGKGVSQIVTNLLTWQGSAIVLDVKGENYDLTAEWRKNKLGQKVYRFAPFSDGSRWNPLDSIVALVGHPDAMAEMQDAVALLIELMFVPPPGGSRDPFWQNSAKQLVQGILMHVCTAEFVVISPEVSVKAWNVQERTMAEVRRLLTLPPPDFLKLLNEMRWSSHSWVVECSNTTATTMASEKQWVGVLTEAIDQTAVWGYERVKRATATSDFSFAAARNDTTIYLCIPPEHIHAYRTLLRVLTGCAMRDLKDSFDGDKSRLPVLMILDEFPQLQYIKPIEDSLAYIAGYGVKLWFFIQDLGQFQHHYPTTWRTFIANCGVRCFFGVSDFDTAKLVSDMSGQSTVMNVTTGESTSRSQTKSTTEGVSSTKGGNSSSSSGAGGGSSSSGSSWSTGTSSSLSESFGITVGSSRSTTHVARALITPGEVMCLNEREQIIFIRGERPIRAWQLRYYEHHEMEERAAALPSFRDTWTPPPLGATKAQEHPRDPETINL